MSKTLTTDLSTHFKGLKRKSAIDISHGNGEIKIGKDPLSFSLYRYLSLQLFIETSREYIFARCFMLICWNLMSRASNAFGIHYQHLEWMEDSLCVYFSHMKNDQTGERKRDPRHLYANPLMPEICPILALGIYFMCFEFDTDNDQLFPGNNQYDRFRKLLGRSLQIESIAAELEHRSVAPADIGTHSFRKGAATFCSSGSTSCPSSAAIHLRAGWALGGVQDTYMRYESAGDMHVGRTVSGLPCQQAEFALLPPYFAYRTEHLDSIISICYPNLPKQLQSIAEYCLASVVYHQNFLRNNLPKNHPIFSTYIFRQSGIIDEFYQNVRCHLPDTDGRQATGIPPHISILGDIRALARKIELNLSEQQANVKKIINGVMDELEARAVSAGTVTKQGLRESLLECLQEAGVMRIVEEIDNPSTVVQTEQHRREIYNWGGGLHFFPTDFNFPSGGVLEAWQYWKCGDSLKGYPPLQLLEPKDLATTNLRKRLSDFRFLMNKLEARAHELGLSTNATSIEEAIQLYDHIKTSIDVSNQSSHNRKRRIGQISWLSVVDILRKQNRRAS